MRGGSSAEEQTVDEHVTYLKKTVFEFSFKL